MTASLSLFGMAAAAPPSTPSLRPEAFSELDPEVVMSLNAMGCLVPQAVNVPHRPNNVVRGEFMKKGRPAWAVLCSRKGRSSILIFDARGSEPEASLAEKDDFRYMSNEPDGEAIFCRNISAVGRAYILEHDRRYGNRPPLPKIDHDGIDDAFMEKASRIHYWTGRKWRTLAGAD
jgi:hypothetical protein